MRETRATRTRRRKARTRRLVLLAVVFAVGVGLGIGYSRAYGELARPVEQVEPARSATAAADWRTHELAEARVRRQALARTAKPAARRAEPTWKSAVASWYGVAENGHATASGVYYTADTWGVASCSLPLGTVLEIRYRGRVAHRVPVIDRGPWIRRGGRWIPHPTRKLDLSEGLAGFLRFDGVQEVDYRIVARAER